MLNLSASYDQREHFYLMNLQDDQKSKPRARTIFFLLSKFKKMINIILGHK